MYVGGGDVSVDRTGGDLGRSARRLIGLDTGPEDITCQFKVSSARGVSTETVETHQIESGSR